MQFDGIILMNKPKGYTSHDVVAITRKTLTSFFRAEKSISPGQKCPRIKVGHCGTLDPNAEGVLPICVGRATKFVDYLANGRKQYRATLKLGIISDTQDIWGQEMARCEVTSTCEEIEATVRSFVGNIKQIPPMYSAIKQNGKKLYELARKGIEVERPPRDVTIHNIEILSIGGRPFVGNGDSVEGGVTANVDEIEMLVDCSKGTYIRTLCHDIGEKLGCGGVMSGLVRTKVGGFSLEECCSLDKPEFIKTAVAIGTFDGVHIAHQALIKQASAGGMKPVALVIEPSDGSGSVVTTLAEKTEKLQQCGAAAVVPAPLGKVRDLSCEEFFDEYIVKRLSAGRVSVGFNFRFGRKREGDVETLRRLCEERGIELVVLSAMKVNGQIVSSTLIREKIKNGEDFAGFI